MSFLSNGDFKSKNLSQFQIEEEIDVIRSIIKRHMFYNVSCEIAKVELVLTFRNPQVLVEVELVYTHTYDIHKEYELKMSKEEVLIDGLFEELMKMCNGITKGKIMHSMLGPFTNSIQVDILKQIKTSLIFKKQSSIKDLSTDLLKDTLDPVENFYEFLNPTGENQLVPITDETWM